MARGRMINSKITRNKAINDLSDDTSRLAFTWLVTFADVEGRTNGDPALVRSLVFPRRTDVTVDQMAGYIQEWAAAGLVTWYEAEGDMWIAFPSFEDNQRGLDRRKEPVSDIPAPTDYVPSTEQVRTEHVPSTVEEKRTEQKLKRRECDADAPVQESAAATPNNNGFGKVLAAHGIIVNSQIQSDNWRDMYQDAGPELFNAAMTETAKAHNGIPTAKYVAAILKRCKQDGVSPGQWKDGPARASPSPPAKPAPTTWRNPISGKVESL